MAARFVGGTDLCEGILGEDFIQQANGFALARTVATLN